MGAYTHTKNVGDNYEDQGHSFTVRGLPHPVFLSLHLQRASGALSQITAVYHSALKTDSIPIDSLLVFLYFVYKNSTFLLAPFEPTFTLSGVISLPSRMHEIDQNKYIKIQKDVPA